MYIASSANASPVIPTSAGLTFAPLGLDARCTILAEISTTGRSFRARGDGLVRPIAV